MHGGRISGVHLNRHLSVVDAGEVASTGRLVLLRLKSEREGVHTGVGAARVVVVGLHLVEVLALLLLETVLTVENELEGVEGAVGILGEILSGTIGTEGEDGDTGRRTEGHIAVGVSVGTNVGLEDDLAGLRLGGEVPEGGGDGGVGEAERELLNGVVVGEADLLGLSGSNGIGASVLHLLDEVLVALLGEAATLLGVKVDVVGPDLEDGLVKVGLHVRREVNVNADLVVLEGNEGKIETGVTVEEEDEGEVDSLTVNTGGHLTPVELLSLIEVELGVEAPPLLVVLVDTLTTNGKLDVVHGTLGDPARVGGDGGVGRGSVRLELDVHITDEITVAGNGNGNAAGVRGSTVHGLLDVLHSEVSVALILGLVESNLRVTGKVNVLGTVRDELHETASHCESFCTISREKNFRQMRKFGL